MAELAHKMTLKKKFKKQTEKLKILKYNCVTKAKLILWTC